MIAKGLLPYNFLLRFLASSPVILTFAFVVLSFAMSTPYYYNQYIGMGTFQATGIFSLLFLDIFTFFLFFILPLIMGQLFFREKPNELGLRLPSHRKTAVWLIIFALCKI